MSRYSDDPRRIVARFSGTDANGRAFAKGEEITFYPRSKRTLSGEAGAQAWRDFEAARADEAFMSGGW